MALREGEVAANIIRTVRHSFPHLRLFLRAHSRLEAYEYLELGEENVYRETLDSSLVMSTDIMEHLGTPRETAERIAKRYRENDEQMVRKMAAHHHNRTEYVSRAKEYVQALDELMRSDLPGEKTENDR